MSRKDKTMRAAHIKSRTEGTSNEISFSVLDAAKNNQDAGNKGKQGRFHPHIGGVSLFTLGKTKKPASTPTKEKGLTLSTGEFVSADKGRMAASQKSKTSLSASEQKTEKDSSLIAPVSSNASFTGSFGKIESKTPSVLGEGPSAVSGWQNTRSEVAQRKAHRLGRRRFAIAICCLIVAVAVVLGCSAVFKEIQSQQNDQAQLVRQIEALLESDEENLDEFRSLVEDSINLSLEDLSQRESPLSDEKGMAFANLGSASKELDELKNEISGTEGKISNTADKDRANQALTMINADEDTMKSGRDILNIADTALGAYSMAQDAWSSILLADSYARDAANLVNAPSDDNMKLSSLKSESAIDALVSSRDKLNQIQTSFSVDLMPYIDYIGLRIDAQYAAIDSNNAFIDRNASSMSEANDTYNTLDSQAVDLIKEVDSTPMAEIERSYKDQIELLSATYSSQKAIVDGARTSLSDWLAAISPSYGK